MLQSMSRVAVTGGAGLLGAPLCERLLSMGREVVCIDNLSTGTRARIAPLLDHPRFTLVCHDITRPLALEADAIYHLACPASPVQYQRDPVGTGRTCAQGTLTMLDLARRLQAPLLLASSSEVYGDPATQPQAEDDWGRVNPVGPRACYDEGKRFAEAMCFDYQRQYGVAVKVARIFNTYGPGMQPDDGRVVASLIGQALRGVPLTVHGDGRQTRSFCYVDDMVAGLVQLMATGPEVTGPLNLGRPEEVSVVELAERVRAITGSHSPIRHTPLPEDDPIRRRPDIGRARALLAWAPEVDLDTGLRRTAAHFRAILEAGE